MEPVEWISWRDFSSDLGNGNFFLILETWTDWKCVVERVWDSGPKCVSGANVVCMVRMTGWGEE